MCRRFAIAAQFCRWNGADEMASKVIDGQQAVSRLSLLRSSGQGGR